MSQRRQIAANRNSNPRHDPKNASAVKQTQFPHRLIARNPMHNNDLRRPPTAERRQKQTQSNPIFGSPGRLNTEKSQKNTLNSALKRTLLTGLHRIQDLHNRQSVTVPASVRPSPTLQYPIHLLISQTDLLLDITPLSA